MTRTLAAALLVGLIVASCAGRQRDEPVDDSPHATCTFYAERDCAVLERCDPEELRWRHNTVRCAANERRWNVGRA